MSKKKTCVYILGTFVIVAMEKQRSKSFPIAKN